jgi:hypothetical protein
MQKSGHALDLFAFSECAAKVGLRARAICARLNCFDRRRHSQLRVLGAEDAVSGGPD